MKARVPREILEPLSGILGVSSNTLRICAGYNSVDMICWFVKHMSHFLRNNFI